MIALEVLLEMSVGGPLGQLRAIPVRLSAHESPALLLIYCADFENDPYEEMFFFPTDPLKLMLIRSNGEILWRHELGRGVVPGMWFCPVLAFDLDGDGVDEIWFVNNPDPKHPLGVSHYHLERLDARTGESTGHWKWPNYGGQQNLSSKFRNFILGGHVRGEPVLVTAQGTYGAMFLQGWKPGMTSRWEHRIEATDPGARGSHMSAIADLDGDGVQEVMWGERCIEFDTGKELFCADREGYRGHSDLVQPVLNRATDKWSLYTCRESDGQAVKRVVAFDAQGKRVWGHVDEGHMDMGWVAHLSGESEPTAMAIKIGHKTCGPDGRFHHERTEFVFKTLSGTQSQLPFSVYGTLPVDLNGDGYHELIRGIPGQNGDVLDQRGQVVGSIGRGTVAMLSKFIPHPGEQILAHYPDGKIRIWADRNAHDSPVAMKRYANPFYAANQRLTAVGINMANLGGL
jgi:hypothetical protein